MPRPSYYLAEDLAGHIADARWGTEIDLTDDQIRECLQLADALTKLGYHKTGDGAADAAQTMGGSLPLAVPSSPTREQLIDDAARALCLDPHNGTACDMHRVDGALVVDALIAAGHLVAGNGEGSGPVQIGGQSGAASPFVPHRFKLHRHSDPSGVSGTGDVAEGVEFADGSVALHWPGEHPSTAVWGDIDGVLFIHGHEGQTEIRWIDDRPIDLCPAEGGNDDD